MFISDLNKIGNKTEVKILKRWSQSASNSLIYLLSKDYTSLNSNETGTSETLCNGITVTNENIKPISVHVPVHLKPTRDNQFGFYLAGLIDGIGNFNKDQKLIIPFNKLDSSLAYYIKKRIGYGRVTQIKDSNSILLVIEAIKGIERVISLINGKILTENKLTQITENILNHPNYSEFNKTINLHLNKDKNLTNNHWLAGFTDASQAGNFQIKLITTSSNKVNLSDTKNQFEKSISSSLRFTCCNLSNKNKLKLASLTPDKIAEIQLNFQLTLGPQTDKKVLELIKNSLGGNILCHTDDLSRYESIHFGTAKKLINYFDHYHLLSSQHVNYLKWRKTYIIIQNKDHLKQSGLDKICKFKKTIEKFNDSLHCDLR